MYTASTPFEPKLFRDPVHDYISVPKEYCRRFIDTQEFQRLRYVEQTSMRVLFPSARHDRFIHSLGAYHLGAVSFHTIKNNYPTQESLSSDDWELLKRTFEIACLLHDVAHAPFSHTLEGYFERTKTKITDLIKLLARQERIKDRNLHVEISALIEEQCPKAHEMASACLVLSRYYDDIEACDASPELAARMIVGCEYVGTDGEEFKRIANIFIGLLNGTSIDVDKLDYILRDTWASGISNVRPDIQRLISSMRIHENEEGNKHLSFHKSGLSAIQQVFDARSHLHRWIFSHHKVVYGCELINKSFDSMFSTNAGNYKFKTNMDLHNYCVKTEFSTG